MEFIYEDFEAYRNAQTVTYKSFESDQPKWKHGQDRFIRLWLDQYPRSSHILDCACGDGVGLRVFKELGFTNVEGIELCEDKLNKAGQYGFNVHFGDMHEMNNLFDLSFDVVYSSHTLEHALDPIKALRELKRIMKAEGHLVLVLPYPDTGPKEAHCAKHILGSDLDDNAQALTAVLESMGFKVLEKRYDDFREPEVWLRLALK